MSIAEKTLRLKQDFDEVFDAGYAKGKSEGGGEEENTLYYTSSEARLVFAGTVFPANHTLVFRMKNGEIDFYQTFYLAEKLKGVKIITENTESPVRFAQTFRECTDLEIVDLTECSRRVYEASYMFFSSTKVRSVLGALDLSDCTNDSTVNYAFFASGLQDVEFVPGTIMASIRFSSASLTNDSIESIIDGLADLTGGETKTLTLNGVGASLTEAQRARISAKNWTLTY